jgi:hypothetical protein
LHVIAVVQSCRYLGSRVSQKSSHTSRIIQYYRRFHCSCFRQFKGRNHTQDRCPLTFGDLSRIVECVNKDPPHSGRSQRSSHRFPPPASWSRFFDGHFVSLTTVGPIRRCRHCIVSSKRTPSPLSLLLLFSPLSPSRSYRLFHHHRRFRCFSPYSPCPPAIAVAVLLASILAQCSCQCLFSSFSWLRFRRLSSLC